MKYRPHRLLITLILGLLSLGTLASASEAALGLSADQTELKQLQSAKQFVFERKWDEAVKALEDMKAAVKDMQRISEVRYWLAYSLNKQAGNRHEYEQKIELLERAFEELSALEKQTLDSRWNKDGRILGVEIARELVAAGVTTYKKHITSASKKDEDIELKLMALDALMHIDADKAFPILERTIRSHADRRMREKALFVLSQCEHPRQIALLRELAIRDSDQAIREKAVFWLGQAEGQEALEALRSLYTMPENEGLKDKIIFAVSQQGSTEAVRILIALYRTESRLEIKKRIIFWLGQTDHDEARRFIESLLN